MVAVPPVLLVTMYVAFQELTVQFGFRVLATHRFHDALGLGGLAYVTWLT